MDTATFLARVVAPGNYLALCYKGPGKPMGTRFFPRNSLNEVTGFARWADGKGMDVWYAPASFRLAEANYDATGRSRFKGERTQTNADQLQCYWYDADIKREGDGKDPTRCFPSFAAVEEWATNLTGIPAPNLWVRSGYGVHLYWVLENPMPRLEWQTSAEHFKAGLIANHAVGDVGISGDAARILRPPNTRNHKIPEQPQPVTVIRDDT